MKKIDIIASIAIYILAVSPVITQAATFNVMSSGATGNGVTDDNPAILSAIDAAVAAGGANTVLFPAGSYNLYSGYDSLHHLYLQNASNITFQGDTGGGTYLYSSDYTKQFFGVVDCQNITFNDIKMDINPLVFTQGTVTSINTTNNTMQVTIDSGYCAPNASQLGSGPRLELFTDLNTVSYDQVFQPSVTAMSGSGSSWQFTLNETPEAAIVGKKFALWQANNGQWAYGIVGCANIFVENCAYYGGGGGSPMGVGPNPGKVTFQNFYVGPPPGSNRILTAEGGSMDACNRGAFTLTNCQMSGIDDDGINSLAGFDPVYSSPASNQILIQDYDNWEVGDTVQIWDWTEYEEKIRQTAQVTAVTQQGSNWLITFNQNVTILVSGAAPGTGWDNRDRICDPSSSGPLIMTNCTFSANRARPILCKSQNSQITGCTIYDSPSPGVMAGTALDAGDEEGPNPSNLTISGCTFNDIDAACIDVGVFDDLGSRDITNVLIKNNTFEFGGQHQAASYSVRGVGVRIRNANGAVIENNIFSGEPSANIIVQDSENVEITGNVFENPESTLVAESNQYQNYEDANPVDSSALVWLDDAAGVTISGNMAQEIGPYNNYLVEATSTCSGVTGQYNGVINCDGELALANLNSNLLLENPNSGAAGTALDQQTWLGSPTQLWQIIPSLTAVGSAQLVNQDGSYLCAGVNSSMSSGQSLLAENPNGAVEQLWTAPAPTTAWSSILLNDDYSDLYAGVSGSSLSTGAAISQMADSGGNNQLWHNTNVPFPWQDTDINPGEDGGARFAGGVFSIAGSGDDIWGTTDGFHFTYEPISGNATIIARITSVGDTDPWAKSGIMVRENLTSGSRFAFLAVNPQGTTQFLYRAAANTSAADNGDLSSGAPLWLMLVRNGNVISGYYSVDDVNWIAFAGTSITLSGLSTSVDVGLADTSHNPNLLSFSTFDNVSINSNGAVSLPFPFFDADVNDTGVAGGAGYSSGTYTLAGSGSDIWNNTDGFNFAPQALSGNGSIIAKVTSVGNSNGSAKSGVMIRESLSGGSRFAFLGAFPGALTQFLYRSTANQNASEAGSISSSAPIWLQLIRNGNVISGYYSSSGTSWTAFPGSPVTLAGLAPAVYIGLADTGHNVSALSTSTFTSITTMNSDGFPIGFNDFDVGAPPITGTAADSAGMDTVTGCGSDIWGTSDQFHFVERPLIGNGTLTARIDSIGNTSSFAKAGIMVRETLDPAARFIMLTSTNDSQFQLNARETAAAGAVQPGTLPGSGPMWYRLVRSGSVITAYYSTNGTSWTTFPGSPITLTGLTPTVYAGLAVSSNNSSALNTATFDSLTVTTP